ncbi:nuclease-related domain-containing protein [Metabacillus dongyingensis]|uniref:nuclease-related domain-containing protein n=1 Tax=Metabacillus dongyingensis TaxID=2874282 RepID=UPI003B8AA068
MKPRCESLELRILRYLNARIDLPAKDKNHYANLKKGYEGEQKFDEWMKDLAGVGIILNDLLFETNHSLFQIDSLYVSSNTIYLFEVKNYAGDFFIEEDKWYSSSKLEIKNPMHQLKRNESLLRRLLQELKFTFQVEAYLIFINPEFQLYQTPLNLPIIVPAQLNRFAEKITITSNKLKGVHTALGQKLLSLHLTESPYYRLPNYCYDQLEKGILCPVCYTFYRSLNKMALICDRCKGIERNQSAVLRSAEEFRMLFPTCKITTNQIHDWCSIIKNKKFIWKILSKNYKKEGHGKSANYIDIF